MRLLHLLDGPAIQLDGKFDGELDDDALAALYAVPDRTTPRVRVNVVTSLDGAVDVDGHSEGLSSAGDKRVFRLLRAECDAVLVGAGTLRTEDYRPLRLDAERRARRRAAGLTEVPVLVVVSGQLAIDPAHPALNAAPVRPVVVTAASAPAARRSALTPVADLVVTDGPTVDIAAALDALAARGLPQVLSEGGPVLLGALQAAGRVDELCLTVSPLSAGPGARRITVGAPTPPRSMRLQHVVEDGGALLLRYGRPAPPTRSTAPGAAAAPRRSPG